MQAMNMVEMKVTKENIYGLFMVCYVSAKFMYAFTGIQHNISLTGIDKDAGRKSEFAAVPSVCSKEEYLQKPPLIYRISHYH